ncbi:MAG: hypothetical protein ACAH95_05325 [Fimbriimonas sp.]
MEQSTLDWLMEGDRAIRWQTMRDLLDAPEAEWNAERDRVADEGWGAALLAFQLPDASWPAGRWTDTTWTLLLLMDFGLPPSNAGARRAVEEHYLSRPIIRDEKLLTTRLDLCHVGFWLRFGSYFYGTDERLLPLVRTILNLQMEDGGWNCRRRNYPDTKHSSFHTTFNVLEGLREAAHMGLLDAEEFRGVETLAMEFMLQHRMYKSDKTDAVISERFTHLSFPSHWHYTVLRGLDYMRDTVEIMDARLDEPCKLLQSRMKANGRWPVEHRIPGKMLIDMEKMGGDSRWNTLRALRVLRNRSGPLP